MGGIRGMVQQTVITKEDISRIESYIVKVNPQLILTGVNNPSVREEVTKLVKKEFKDVVLNDEDARYVANEIVGLGVISDIQDQYSDVTDIGYNGTELMVKTNTSKFVYKGRQDINEEYIVKLIGRMANTVKEDFSPKNSRINLVLGNLRLNAIHKDNSGSNPQVTTMSIRVVNPRLALNATNFNKFGPKSLLRLFKAIMETGNNIVISGEMGVGKTELHKLLLSYVPPKDKVVLIEDVSETHAKALFPDKDIYSWVTNPSTTISDLVAESLRNDADWIMVTESRGQEAYEMVQAVLGGHKVVTSLHTVNARAIPRRLISMSKIGYDVDEKSMYEDITRYFEFGIHLRSVVVNGKVRRFLDELVYFSGTEGVTVVKQKLVDGVLYGRTYEIPDFLREKMAEEGMELDFDENIEYEIDLR